jgi:acyl carrier protein
LGKPALTINWGPWSGSGMAANLDARDIQRMNEAGMHALSPKQGLAAISKLLAYRFPQAGVFDLDWSLIAKQYPDPAGKTLFKDFINISQADDSLDFIAQLKSVPAAQRESMLKDRIALLLAEVLGIDNAESIDKDGNVFEYGLNSLMGMDFKNRLQSVLKFKLPATLVSKYSTVDAMVQYVVENGFNEVLAGETMPDGDIVLWNPGIPDTVTNCEINGPLPFTISLLDWFKQGVSKHFNVGFLVEFGEDKFNLEALKTSLRILFTYHDGCRLQIFTEAGEPRQAIVPLGDNLRIDEYDFRGLGYAEGAARMLERNDQYEKSLTLSKGNPLFRIAHYQLDDDRPHRFLLLFHHFLTDGLSQKIFVSDLVSVYSKVFNNHPVKFPPKRNSLINWTRRLHEFAHNEAVEQLPYWESVLERSHLCYIPTDFKVERNRRNKSYNMISVSVEPGDCQRLTDLCSNYRFEITDIAVYAMIKAFSKLTLAESLWVDLVIHARTNVFDDIEMPDIFGQISECSPVLFELEPGLSVIDQLKAIRKQRVRVPTGGLGLKALRYMNKDPDIQNKIGMDEAPQIVLNFDLTNYEIEHAKEWGAIAKETNHNPAPPAVKDDYPREFYITGTVNDLGALTIVFWYYSDSFNKDTVNAIAGRIRSIFIGVANPEVLELERS